VSGVELYKRLLVYALPYRWVFLAGVIGMLAVAVSEASFAALLKPIMDGGFVERDSATIRLTPLLLIGAFLIRGIGSFADQYSIGWVGRRVVFDLRAEMFERMIHFPVRYYDHQSSAALVAKLIYDVEQVASATTMAVRVLIKDTLLTLVLLGWLAYLNWQLTLIFLTVTPIAAFIIRSASRRFRITSTKIQTSIGHISHVSKEAFQGHRILKAFGGYHQEIKSFQEVNLQNRRQAIRKAAVAAASVPLLLLFVGSNVAGVIYLAMTGATGSFISAGTFASYLAAILMLMAPIKRLAKVNELVQAGVAAAESAFQILDEEVESPGGERSEVRLGGAIVFKHVSFRYDNDKPWALTGLSFSLKPGEIVALVGESGSGKSTIASILLGFYSNFEGEVLLDGVSIREYELMCLRQNIAFVPQDAILFDDTIIRNISYGMDENEERIDAVSDATQIKNFSDRLPRGLDTKIGERGERLSGGQRQRIAISRGLYRNAPILILDEATSALDNISEKAIRESIREISLGRTIIMIAHRLTTVIDADCIYVLQGGQIVESGSHSELLLRGGYYKALYQNQLESGQDGDEVPNPTI
jgi:subfamily B ATP-binding cassette protein MsbA